MRRPLVLLPLLLTALVVAGCGSSSDSSSSTKTTATVPSERLGTTTQRTAVLTLVNRPAHDSMWSSTATGWRGDAPGFIPKSSRRTYTLGFSGDVATVPLKVLGHDETGRNVKSTFVVTVTCTATACTAKTQTTSQSTPVPVRTSADSLANGAAVTIEVG